MNKLGSSFFFLKNISFINEDRIVLSSILIAIKHDSHSLEKNRHFKNKQEYFQKISFFNYFQCWEKDRTKMGEENLQRFD